MKIEVETTITRYSKDIKLKPNAPYIKIINTGQQLLFINNNMYLWPRTSITIDLLSVAAKAIAKGFILENVTEFDFRFYNLIVNFPREISVIQTRFKIV